MKLLLLLILSSNIAFAEIEESNEILYGEPDESNIFFRDQNFINKNIKKSHFYLNLETSLLMYKNDISFDGKEAQLKATDSLPLIGPALALGYRFKFGTVSTSSQVSLFHYLRREHDINIASEEIEIPVSEQENESSITGLEFSQRFYLTFQLSERTYIEPFIQVGVGYAQSEAKYEHFYYDYIKSEYYYALVREQLITQNLAVGFNILTQNGLMFIFKVQKNVLTIGERETNISSAPLAGGLGTPTNTNSTIDINGNRDEFSVTLGGGYIF